MSQWWAIGSKCPGICFTNVLSVSRGVLELSVRPIRFETRKTCVSTAIASLLNTTDAITFAVFRPTPGNFCNSSTSEGIIPLNSLSNFFAIPTKCFALLLGYDTLLIYSYTTSGVVAANASGVGKSRNKGGVIIFTRLSVHWADNITAISNWNGSL